MPLNRPENTADTMTWAAIHAEAVSAARTTLELALCKEKGLEITDRPIPWRNGERDLQVFVGIGKTDYWRDGFYLVVDGSLDKFHYKNRHVVTFRDYSRDDGYLHLSISPPVILQLKDATKLRIFRVDPNFVKELSQEYEVLKALKHGPLITDLWSNAPRANESSNAEALTLPPSLNSGQQRALLQMVSPGGTFIWGPPGTGKTTVISQAVQVALLRGQSVLIASSTSEAVDRALERIAGRAEGLGPGTIIRHCASGDKVLGSIRHHDFLLASKAADHTTSRPATRAMLDEALTVNETHPQRTELVELQNELHAASIDPDVVHAQRDKDRRQAQLAQEELTLSTRQEQLSEVALQLAELEAEFHSMEDLDTAIELAQRNRADTQTWKNWWENEKRERESRVAIISQHISIAKSHVELASLRLQGRFSAKIPGVGRRRKIIRAEAEAELAELEVDRLRALSELDEATENIKAFRDQLDAYQAYYEELHAALSRRAGLQQQITVLREELDSVQAHIFETQRRITDLHQEIGSSSASSFDKASLPSLRAIKLVDRYDDALSRVTALDEEKKHIEKLKDILDDEYNQKYSNLLSTAPVVATTLAAIPASPELSNRRFDVVIIDEAAASRPTTVLCAAALADTTLTIIGDFLSTIRDGHPDRTAFLDPHVTAWHQRDIFGLAGITDRKSAENHPRCVTLKAQYRPQIVTETINRLCYDGLLENLSEGLPGRESTIAFIDTSTLSDLVITKHNGELLCPSTVDVAARLASALPPNTTGYVAPYREQALAAEERFLELGIAATCSTASTFQFTTFDCAIIDLMQDDQPRWISAADVRGPKRSIAGAKFLNMALTRASKRLFIIGNWQFVENCTSAGMQTLAALKGHPHFQLISVS